MNFNSFAPIAYRLSVFKCLVYRALRLCSSWKLFHEEIACIRAMLLRNAYPAWILDRIIKDSVSNYLNNTVKFGPPKEKIYVGLPYLGKITDNIRKNIKQICKKFIPHKDVIIYFKPGRRVSSFFRVKDNTPFDMRSCVVYEFTCAACQCSYVGQTSRHLRHRIAEHRGVSHLTGNIMKAQAHSSIRDHCSSCRGSDCSPTNFKILSTASSELELLVKERLLINRLKPALNNNAGAFELLLH